jgi:hypothetical protein
MSVDMEITRKLWIDVPEEIKKPLGELISEIQYSLLYEFKVVAHGEGIEDDNDNGTWPIIDLEVTTGTDPEGSTRRLIVSQDEESLLYHTAKYPGTEGSGENNPKWKAMCEALWYSIEDGNGEELEHNMNYIRPFVKQENPEDEE